FLKDKKVAIIGYGIQGRGQALNLKDSGIEVIVAELEGTPNFEEAKKDGFSPLSAYEASKEADFIQMLAQDHIQPKVYNSEIKGNMKAGRSLIFSHGFNIHFGLIQPPPDVDVFMVAPKGPGSLLREMYIQGKGVPCLVAIHQEYTGGALNNALAYAKAIGGTRIGVIQTTFQEETETDLFGEQVVLCGGVSELIKVAFETLIAAGYQPEVAYFECLHELKLIVDLIYRYGITGMRKRVSDTAEYGDLTRGPRIINDGVRKEMRRVLKEIQSGEFASEWVQENIVGRPRFKTLEKKGSEHLIEKIGRELRKMMEPLEK
ncbi:MAG TPA: ketol-acid reductoisomerase, partial [Candidatus Omnitrophica bacterium]|nr:ketol-acid reductoisomerase [Candidatus Omnitrophota bacterium]